MRRMTAALGALLLLLPPVHAGEPTRIDLFVIGDPPRVVPEFRGVPVQVHRIDGVRQLEAQASAGLPDDEEKAYEIARQRLQDPEWRERLMRAHEDLLLAADWGIERAPAVVFDGEAVVYGSGDLRRAMEAYDAWRR